MHNYVDFIPFSDIMVQLPQQMIINDNQDKVPESTDN